MSHSDEHIRDQQETMRLSEANARIRELESDIQGYIEQREMDAAELNRLESEREEIIDWQGKACDQIRRVLDAWDCEIDANILTELENLREVMVQGQIQMGEL